MDQQDTTELTAESWASWLLMSARHGLDLCTALRGYFAAYLHDDETAEVVAAQTELAAYKTHAVEAGAHLLPVDLPPLDD